MSDLKILFPAKEITLSSGEVIAVKPLTFGQLPKAVELTNKLGATLAALDPNSFNDKQNLAQAMFQLLSLSAEDFVVLLAFVLKKPREWFDELPTQDGVQLSIAFLEVNIGFFTQHVRPVLMKAGAQLKTSLESSSS